jgi:hypothetical protein
VLSIRTACLKPAAASRDTVVLANQQPPWLASHTSTT